MTKTIVSQSPDQTFEAGDALGRTLEAGDLVFLSGGLGAGKTLFTKGVLNALQYDIDEVTSPSFTLVNLYQTERFDVYHIDLWRIEGPSGVAAAVGLDEIIESESAVTLIEWAERLGSYTVNNNTIRVLIEGSGDEARRIEIERDDRID